MPVIPGSTELYEQAGVNPKGKPRWSPKGIVHVSFTNQRLGRISVAASHYLTKGGRPNRPIHGIDRFEWNRRLAHAIGEWATKKGKGSALAFYGGDQNIVDRTEDTFFGSPLTSAWDEVKRWEGTGHGNIDLIASYDKDGRVSATKAWALDDREWPLHTDHFPIFAEYRVRRARPAAK